MAEYIDRTQLEPDTEWSDYDDGFVSYSQSQIRSMPKADVVEREKVNKAMKQIEELSGQSCMVSDGIINEVLDILEECIGE